MLDELDTMLGGLNNSGKIAKTFSSAINDCAYQITGNDQAHAETLRVALQQTIAEWLQQVVKSATAHLHQQRAEQPAASTEPLAAT